MKTTSRIVLAGTFLLAAFVASVTYHVGDQGWDFSLRPADTAARSERYDLRALGILARTVLHVQGNYLDQDKVEPREMLVASLDKVETLLPEVVVSPAPGESEDAPAALRVSVGKASTIFDIGSLDTLWSLREKLKLIVGYIQDHLQDTDVELPKVEYAAINGLLSTLDPHSVLLDPDTYREMRVSTRGDFGGLGIVISIRDDELTVISPLEDTPAWRAGLKAKDKIVRIEDESTINMRLDEAVKRLRGEPGSTVAIWVKRKGWSQPRRFDITRERIVIRSVKSKLLSDGIGYVRLKSFQGHSRKQIREHLERMRGEYGQELRGLILDLRGNPGGLLDQAVSISDLFLDSGTIVLTVGKGNEAKDEPKRAHFSGTEKPYPMAVLVGPGSASASEIVAAALQNNERAVVVGQRTFGKGSVQVLYDMDDGSALKLTIAQYLTPGEVSIQGVGIQPDIELEPVVVGSKRIQFYANDRFGEGDLDAALTNEAAVRRQQQARYVVRYHEKSKEEEEDKEDDTPPPDESVVEVDYPIEFAQGLLHKIGATKRASTLDKAAPYVQEQADDQMERVAGSLAELGMDWSPGAKPTGANVQLRLTTDHEGHRAKAGETLVLRAHVRNLGATTLHRLHALTRCEDPDFRGLEFFFGRLGPGEERTWEVPVELAKSERSRTDLITLELYSGGGAKPIAESALLAEIVELPRPLFAYSWQFMDDKGGNGDGLLQRGEAVDMLVTIRNLGPGDATDVSTGLTNLSGEAMLLEQGRQKVESIPAGDSSAVRFRFRVQPKLTEDRIKVRLDVLDMTVREGVEEEFEVPVLQKGSPLQPADGIVTAMTGGVELHGGASEESPLLGRLPEKRALTVLGRLGPWLKVAASDERPAWVQGNVTLQRPRAGRGRAVDQDAVRWLDQRSPPRITFSDATVALKVSDQKVVRVTGLVEDDQLVRDIYVVSYYQKGKLKRSRKLAFVINEDQELTPTRLPFAVDVPIEPGLNSIAVVARDGDKLISSDSVRVLHRVADASETAAR